MPGRIHKKVIIARSGIYDYAREELPRLGIALEDVPAESRDLSLYQVYRPSTVLEAGKELFARQPVQHEHRAWLDRDNISQYQTGWTGDTVETGLDNGELVLRSTINLLERKGLDAFDAGIREVSPGYDADFVWKPGTTPDGKKYHIIMTRVSDVNHLATTESGRGGPSVAILDSAKGGSRMPKILTGLFRFAKRKGKVMDTDLGTFRTTLEALVAGRATLGDDEIATKVGELEKMAADLPQNEGRDKLERFLADLKQIKSQNLDDEQAKAVAGAVADLFEDLDGQAMAEVAPVAKPESNAPKQGEKTSEAAKPETEGQTGVKEDPVDSGEANPEKLPEAKDQEAVKPPEGDKPQDEQPDGDPSKKSESGSNATPDVKDGEESPEELRYLLGELRALLSHIKSGKPVDQFGKEPEKVADSGPFAFFVSRQNKSVEGGGLSELDRMIGGK